MYELITDTTHRLVVLLSGFVVPIGVSLIRFIPFPRVLVTRFNSWVIYPPLWGSRHKQSILYDIAQVPTRGQALFLGYIVVVNVVLSAAGYRSLQPNAWYPDGKMAEILTYVTNRFGVLSFANIPLIFLYAGRNSVLLWLTDWSHTTFILLHQWIAYIATLQAILHSVVYLQKYVANRQYSSESKLPYWYWGVIATLTMSIALPASIMPIRKKMYEAFLLGHITLSILALVGCYLHILRRFEHQWGYEVFLISAMAVWGFDRVMRGLRIVRNGVCTAQIVPVDDDYLRIDVRGVSATGHAYLYFPTRTWKIWENHPFSVASALLPPMEDGIEEPRRSDLENNEMGSREKVASNFDVKDINSSLQDGSSSNMSSESAQPPVLGLTFFLRTRSGLTSLFPPDGTLPVLVESSYGRHEDLSDHPSLVCIAGGVGVTAVMPYLQLHPGLKKLYWGVRNDGIVKAVEPSLRGVKKQVFVGRRMVLRDVLEEAICDASPDGVAIVVSGPSGMADEARVLAGELGRKNSLVKIKLVEESFGW